MCGIAGEIRFNANAACAESVEKMLDPMAPRGPDGSGVFRHNHVAFGHRRLKIIDLSEHASQPMIDSALGLVIVFNGAIYNYPELRKELEAGGYRFFSTGDTEVILKAYHAWGNECVKRLSGMFAFAIYERDSGKVFCARDRLGIKPFYYTHTPEAFRFASTLPALLQVGEVDTSIDPVALNYYMSFHAVVPAPHTILKGVRKLPPASTLEILPDGRTHQQTYWEVNYQRTEEDAKRPENEWIDLVQEALTTAVKRRLVADVPVGVLLSGGLDSSLVVGLLDQLGQKDINTFSVGFEDAGGEEGNEFKYSDIIAQRFGTKHHKIFVEHHRLREHLSDCIRAMSEPMVSHDVIGFYLLSQEVSKHVKVVQSGQGADEVFAGYHWYPRLVTSTDKEAVTRYADAFFDREFKEYCEAVSRNYIEENYALRFLETEFARPGASEPIDKALRLDTTVMLVDDPVKRVDNMTMAFGLEARVPFLDHDLVELAARIPATWKVRGGGKYVLKEVGRRLIPSEVIDRPKGYFPVPGLKYLEGEYLTMVQDILSSRSAKKRGLFNSAYLKQLYAMPAKHITPLNGSKLWQVALLEYWLQEQGL